MADATDPVKAALEQALSSPESADSQPAKQDSPEVKATPPSDAKPESNKVTDSSKGSDNRIPQDRFSEVVRQKNEALEQLKALEAQFKTATEREQALKTRVGQLETDHQILDAIKELAKDDKYRAHVVAIDKALQGIEEEVEEAKESGDKNQVAELEKKFKSETAKLQDLVSDQRAEHLWAQSNDYASEMLRSLPEEYTNEDRARISRLWNPRVDWDRIEKEGAQVIPDVLKSSLADVIKDYGTPQGALMARTKEEVTKSIPEASRPVDPATAVKSILDTDWAAFNDEGKPVQSDTDFTKAMANLMRKTRGA